MRALVLSLLALSCATGCAAADVAASNAPHVVSSVSVVSGDPQSSTATPAATPISADCGRWTPTATELAAVRKIAIAAAASNIPPGAPRASWIACTRGGYLARSGEGSLRDQTAAAARVIVVIIRGRFPVDAHSEPLPPPGAFTSPSAIAPTVSTLDFDYDPALRYGLDGGTGLPDADIARIGSFQPLSLS
jgi:hypothetical protein